MYHFFVPGAEVIDETIRIEGDNVNHIRNVLRMKIGEKIVISDGQDRDYYCIITDISKDSVLVSVQPEAVEESELPAYLHLFQGLPKSDKMDWIVQKSVELGAVSVIPVEMKRSIVKLDEKKKKARTGRWQTIAESAAKQSGRRIIPEVEPVMSYVQALKRAEEMDLILVPYENAKGMQATKEALERLKPGMHVGIFIGPEGGFELSEIEKLQAIGGESISLGSRILRTETAGLAALTMCMLHLEMQQE